MQDTLQRKFYRKEMEVNALLEITQAVNNNLPEDDLYKIYEFTLRGNLQLSKMVLYVKDEDWDCKVQFGTKEDFTQIPLDAGCLDLTEIVEVNEVDLSISCFSEFDIIIPVTHKEKLLAFVFIKTSEEENRDDTTFIQALSNVILVAIENKRLARKQLEQQATQREMEIARNVQNYLFPDVLPNSEKLEIKAFYQPCKTVGGDYYDYIPIPNENQFLVCIADVSGKGMPAAILMSNFQAVLRTLSRNAESPEQVIHELNHQTWHNAKGENFITFFLAVYDFDKKNLRYFNCGHNHPVLITKDKIMILSEGSTVLGAFDPLPFLDKGEIENLDEFSLFMFTDGLTETFNSAGEEFGDERLRKFLMDHKNKDLQTTHNDLMKELEGFKKENAFADDLTFLSCRVNNATP
ncbi:PP2C family protein-serine/threonine phosphatase [Roseivirga sp.]|uniref:PP2C family protein-serine/threonine phosphatase n=1 Tax=Roseivirga sp. TaxID=1964215 RepID=UPI002B2651A9|nr:PP2C family protein-serine/threonine phosphatase [Roseivirga sp.]